MDLVCEGIDGVVFGLYEVGFGEVAVVKEGPFQIGIYEGGLCEIGFIEVALFESALFKGGPFHLQVGKITGHDHAVFATDGEELRVTFEEIEPDELALLKSDVLHAAAIEFDKGELTLHKATKTEGGVQKRALIELTPFKGAI